MKEQRRQAADIVSSIGAVVIVLIVASGASARIVKNTIDPTAFVSDDGRHLILAGPLECTAGERAYLELTVTQRATGAVASGRAIVTCSGVEGQWELDAEVQGSEPFDDGEAIAVAIARTLRRGVTTDAHQWLVPITLTEE